MNLVLDTFSEVYQYLKPYRCDHFWSLEQHDIVPGAVYIIGRHEIHKNINRWRELIEQGIIRAIFSNPHEGSETIRGQIINLGLVDLVRAGKLPIITGGALPSDWPHLVYDSFLVKVTEYKENLQACKLYNQASTTTSKPYDFLFLNGRMRTHRKWLMERLRIDQQLSRALWTNLDQRDASNRRIKLVVNGEDLMQRIMPLQFLPEHYELPAYRSKIAKVSIEQGTFVKHQLFNNQWGDIYINADTYIDTYFSLITETIFEYPYSFRTEKIAKPLLIGHPWIVASNRYFYKDLKQLGFETFRSVIDESFDEIENDQLRIEKLYQVVEDVLQSPMQFYLDTREICQYNAAHLLKLADQIRQEMPDRLLKFIEQCHGKI